MAQKFLDRKEWLVHSPQDEFDLSAFVNKVLLEHGHTHSWAYCPFLLHLLMVGLGSSDKDHVALNDRKKNKQRREDCLSLHR